MIRFYTFVCFVKNTLTMKKLLFLWAALIIATVNVHALSKIVLEGNYQGKNLYVQNPFTSTGVGFCTAEVTINGEKTTDEINSSAFEIDFENFNLELGSKVVVEITHKDDCKPKVLNPEVLKPRSTFETITIKVSKEALLDWNTRNEIGKLPYIIEQFRWNKWVKVAEVEGKGNLQANEYNYKVVPHAGNNLFRVKQVDASGKPRYSPEAKFRSMIPEVTFKLNKNTIVFSGETMYEVFDKFGNIVRKGIGTNLDITSLAKGEYYLNYDNTMKTFKK